MIIGKENLGELDYQFRTGFNAAFSLASTAVVDRIATVIPATSGTMRLTGVKAFGYMREWLGKRHHKNIEALGFTAVIRKFEDTVDVLRDDLEDDNYGQYMPQIQAMGKGAAQLDARLVAAVLQGSAAATGYDGLALGANTHSMKSTTYDNLVTTAMSQAAIKTAIDWFGSLVDDGGEELAITPTHLVTRDKGSAYWAGRKFLLKEQVSDGAGAMVDNETYQTLEHLPMAHITSDTFWAVLALTDAVRPVLLLRRTLPEMTAKTNPDSDGVFEEDKYSWGVRYRVEAVPGPWQLAYTSTGAG